MERERLLVAAPVPPARRPQPGTMACSTRLRHAVDVSQALDVPLEVALFLDPEAMVSLIRSIGCSGCCVRPYAAGSSSTARPWLTPMTAWLRRVRKLLGTVRAAVPFISGTNSHFTALNRGGPPVDLLDGVCYAIMPQVHAFDESVRDRDAPGPGLDRRECAYVPRAAAGPRRAGHVGRARARAARPPEPWPYRASLPRRRSASGVATGRGWTLG